MLAYLADHERASMQEIARALGIPPLAVDVALRRLAARGLVGHSRPAPVTTADAKLELERLLERLVADGLAERIGVDDYGRPIYQATAAGVLARERSS